MANSAFFLTSCIREKLVKKDPHRDDEFWSWRATDLPAQGKVVGKLLDWSPVQRDKPGYPVLYADAASAPLYAGTGVNRVDFLKGARMVVNYAPPQPIRDTYYLRWHGTFDNTSPRGEWLTLYRIMFDDTPFELLHVQYFLTDLSAGGAGNLHVNIRVTAYDTRGADGGFHQFTIPHSNLLRTNYGHQLKLFFDSTGVTWQTEGGEGRPNVLNGREDWGHPLFKPVGSQRMVCNNNGADASGDGVTRWYNIGMGTDINTAPPYP